MTEAFPETETIVADSAYKRPQTMKGGHEWWKYVYDEYYDCVICPEYQVLSCRTTSREGYREYRSDPRICADCPTRHTPKYRELYERRKETIERVFAGAKEKHAMRYTQYRGLAQAANWVKLKFAAMNLKKLAIRRWRDKSGPFALLFLWPINVRNPVSA